MAPEAGGLGRSTELRAAACNPQWGLSTTPVPQLTAFAGEYSDGVTYSYTSITFQGRGILLPC